MPLFFDDLEAPVQIAPGGAERIVSLVPSLTEALAVVCRDRLVGATDWCTHPADLDVARVRGTKNPNLPAVRALKPDLVVANREENRALDVERLRASGIAVWVTEISTVSQAISSMNRLLAAAAPQARPPQAWSDVDAVRLRCSGQGPRLRVAIPIWRDPWMWVGAQTFSDDVARTLGWDNVVTTARYPTLSPQQVRALDPDVLLLPDEPWAFTARDLAQTALDGVPALEVSGRLLTWYGPALAELAWQRIPRDG